MDMYIKNDVTKSIANVIQHVNFQVHRAYLAGVIWKNREITTIM